MKPRTKRTRLWLREHRVAFGPLDAAEANENEIDACACASALLRLTLDGKALDNRGDARTCEGEMLGLDVALEAAKSNVR